MPKRRRRDPVILNIVVSPVQARFNRSVRRDILRLKRTTRGQSCLESGHSAATFINGTRSTSELHGQVIFTVSGDNFQQSSQDQHIQRNNHIILFSRVDCDGELRTINSQTSWSHDVSMSIRSRFLMEGGSFSPDPSASSSYIVRHTASAEFIHLSCTSHSSHRNDLAESISPYEVQSTPNSHSSCRAVVDHLRRYYCSHVFGGPNVICNFCGAHMWLEESVDVRGVVPFPVFSLCCKQGMISLPQMKPTPAFLDDLLDYEGRTFSRNFREKIRTYNSLFQFTSLGGKIDNSVNNGFGPYIFRLNGQTHHRIGSLLPLSGHSAKFVQLYVYDTTNEVSNRISAVTGDDDCVGIDRDIVQGLIAMLDQTNEIVKVFRYARDRYEQHGYLPMRIRLLSSRDRNYSTPTVSEIAGLVVGDIGEANGDRDIIFDHRQEGLKRISNLHPLYMSLQYPLLFPFGEDGFMLDIPYIDSPVKEKVTRKTVSMREYYAYIIQNRSTFRSTLLRGGRLFQQFCVDAFSAVEESRLTYIRNNQTQIRAEMYRDVRDAMDRSDTEGASIGKRIILPGSFTAGPRYLFQNYQDAMAICRSYGYPDLFITFTCNAQWIEIQQALRFVNSNRPEDRPDLVSRVFKIKLKNLLHDLLEENHFGPSLAVTYTIEFQKRGLPHVHILLWLQPSAKLRTPQHIDRYISAELPNQDLDPVGYEAVACFMIHGPCGGANMRAPCMKEGKCLKFFPKEFKEQTMLDQFGFPSYRRRDNGSVCLKNGVELDNRFVVPHNVDLVVRHRAHINVEICNQTRAIKYLFKYINKGPDRAKVVLEKRGSMTDLHNNQQRNERDEIKAYLDCRYISSYEACWRLFRFEVHHRKPAVIRLLIHLPNEQSIYFRDHEQLSRVLERADIEKTIFTEWMTANQNYESARDLLYADFPTKWVWQEDLMKWTPRQRGRSIGRVVYINPAAGELYYLRLLLNVVKGPRSFEEIRTVNGVLYPTFQAACDVHGLLGDDKEWQEALLQASHWATANELRHLFATIVMFCEVANVASLFENNWRIMADDIEYRFRQALNAPRYTMPDEDLKNYVLVALEDILTKNCTSLAEKKLPQPRSDVMTTTHDRLIFEELNYNLSELEQQHLDMLQTLNPEQRRIYEFIRRSVDQNDGCMFFVYGHGGTGKTFLWKTIIAGIRSTGQIVLAVASSGIASLLLPGGRTAHSRFKIPITIDEWSTCEIKKGTQLARLLQQTSLIVWDEAAMIHRHCLEALDKSLRDVLSSSTTMMDERPFGGKTVVFGGDFRKILPVIQCGTKSDILNATICNSKLWENFQVFTLKTNMRLMNSGFDEASRNELQQFAQWLLDIGDGRLCSVLEPDDEEGNWIEIPEELLIHATGDPLQAIFEAVYYDFEDNYAEPMYLTQRAIITPHNETVDSLNEHILQLIPGPSTTYYSHDSISKTSTGPEDHSQYPSEILNILTFPGVPNHQLNMKVGCVVMLLRNISPVNGLCNGTRLLITQLAMNVIEAKIISGDHLGKRVFIPRIIFTVKNKQWPFVLNRKQFPLRLSYAMTINKSQGQTLNFVGVYLPKPVFTHGQLYVAFSRVTSRHGLKVLIHDDDGKMTHVTRNVVYTEIFDSIQGHLQD